MFTVQLKIALLFDLMTKTKVDVEVFVLLSQEKTIEMCGESVIEIYLGD